ncbi:MAG TPA: DNA recombination protein RmuC [Candidatus Limnocylindrales bacterium]|nr:DNA recombination protein RmuC [Candidatus Limnocylindrales bacterium]
MIDSLAIAVLFASTVSAILTVFLLMRSGGDAASEISNLEGVLQGEMRLGREEAARAARELREENARSAAALREEDARSAAALREELARVTGLLRDSVDQRLRDLQTGNEARLDEMRRTVDEKLHDTLEKRLGESFRTVSVQLEAVHKGLGEMQTLASGVGDLKKVLSNVKARGTWGEVQLGALLEQVLIPEQFDRNVATRRGSRDVVEFAVRLPGTGDSGIVHLPIDSKFPMEDYARLVDASDAGDREGAERASADLARAVRKCAQDIRDKYLDPPHTTDFGILFLPTEGLFAEVVRHPGLSEELHQKFRVVATGPTTLAATLSSLRMGFRTLAIEKRASEVWQVLAAVKTEFQKFGGVLSKVKSQLETATRTIDETGVRTRVMQKRLGDVESLSDEKAAAVLGTADSSPAEVADAEEVLLEPAMPAAAAPLAGQGTDG